MLGEAMRFLTVTVGGNTVVSWVAAAVAFVALTVGVLVVKRVALRWLTAAAARTANGLDDVAVRVASRTRVFLALAVGLLGSRALVVLSPEASDVVWRVLIGLVVVQGGLWGSSLLQHAIERYVQRTDALVGNATGVLRMLGVTAIWTVVVLLLLANLGVDVTAGIAGLGIGGVAVALAVQNILGDLFASLSIVFDRPFGVGDFVVVGESAGTVEHIGIKTTRIRSLSGELLVFGNSDLLASRIQNFRDMRERRVVLRLGVAYGTPAATLRQIPAMICDAVSAAQDARFERAHFYQFGESSLDFEAVWYVESGDYIRFMEVQHAVYLGVLDRLTDAGVDIPFPQRTIWMQRTEPSVPKEKGDVAARA